MGGVEGKAFRERREASGKSLEEVSRELRISRRYLQGIESGEYSGWPPKVFSAGFIRAYASYLGLDPEPVLSEYYRHLQDRSEPVPTQIVQPQWVERERRKGSRRNVWLSATAAVLLLGVFLAWLSVRLAPKVPSGTEPVPPPPLQAPAPVPEEPPAVPAPKALPAPEGTPGGNAAPPTGPATTVVGGTGPVTAPYQLFLEANERTWLMYSRDGREPVDVTLYPGDRLSIQAEQSLYLKVGNAGGVVATLNGTLLPPFGEKGEVKEFRAGR